MEKVEVTAEKKPEEEAEAAPTAGEAATTEQAASPEKVELKSEKKEVPPAEKPAQSNTPPQK